MALEDKTNREIPILKNERSEHPNESRDQSTFNNYCTCDSPSVDGYATGYALAICKSCGGKVPD